MLRGINISKIILILVLLVVLPSCELFVDGIFEGIEYEMEKARTNAQEPASYFSEIIRNAESGDKGAQQRLANMYRYGLGVSRDTTEAEKWERLANSED